jgi:hypothetical protein
MRSIRIRDKSTTDLTQIEMLSLEELIEADNPTPTHSQFGYRGKSRDSLRLHW